MPLFFVLSSATCGKLCGKVCVKRGEKCQKWPFNVTSALHLATPGKCNTSVTSINNNTNIVVGCDKKLFLKIKARTRSAPCLGGSRS